MGEKAATAYLVKDARNGQLIAFVPHPTQNGVWCRVNACVLLPWQCSQCGSKQYVPCKGELGDYTTQSHCARRPSCLDERKTARLIYEKRGIRMGVSFDIKAASFRVCRETK